MTALAGVDVLVIAAYFAVTLIAGLLLTRRASRGLEEYYLGGRSVPWYFLGIAGMASWFDLAGTMIITSFLYLLGPRGLYIEFRGGAVLILAFLIAYTGKWHRRSGCMTSAEWVTYRFGSGKAAEWMRVLTAVMAILTTVGMLAYLVRGASLFVGVFVPYPAARVTAGLLIVCGLYTMLSGFYGVVLTDLIQGIVVLTACLAVSLLAFRAVGDTTALGALAVRVTGNAEWMDTLPHWHTSMPRGYETYEPLVLFAAFYLLRNLLWGLGTGGESRYFAARSDRDCGLQSLLQGLAVTFRWPLMLSFAVLGLLLVGRLFPGPGALASAAAIIHRFHPQTDPARWHEVTAGVVFHPDRAPAGEVAALRAALGPDWRVKLPLIGESGTINPELILPAVIFDSMPAGLRGLILVAMLAAMMSNLAGTVNGASALMIRDIYQYLLRPAARNRELIGASYAAAAALLGAGFWMGIHAKSINELWGWIIMALGGGALAPWILRLYWWRCNAWGMAGGTVLGGAGALLQRWLLPGLLEWKQFLVMGGLSFAGTVVLSLLTAPTDRKTLEHFYRTTRPFGWWAPLARATAPELRKRWARENRQDLSAIPFLMVAQITAFLLPMQLVIHAYSPFWRTLPIFGGAVAGVYWFWWRNLPPPSAPATATAAAASEQ